MRALLLVLAGLFSVTLSLATWLEPWFQSWEGSRARGGNLLAVALGDSRRLFANQVFLKADAYFHSGYYPSMFDARPAPGKGGLNAAGDGHVCALDFLGQPQDWLERFGRHFYPSTHLHLGEIAEEHAKHVHKPGESEEHEQHAPEDEPGTEREMLPWLRLAASLDPEEPQNYVIAAYWLRTRLGKVKEAEQFLREGMRANPGNPDLLFELGRIYRENHADPARARNLWELALAKWREKDTGQLRTDLLLYRQLLGNLAKLEEERKNYPRAIEHLQALEKVVSDAAPIRKWIDEMRQKR
jgi:hypothetical protein